MSAIIGYTLTMTSAFGHLIIAWLAGKGYEYLNRKKLGHYTWFFLLIGAIIPDIDHLFDWVLDISIHRTITHSVFFLMVIPSTVFFAFKWVNEKSAYRYAFFLAIGILIHLTMDLLSHQGVVLFWPYPAWFSTRGIYFLTSKPAFFDRTAENILGSLKTAVLDLALGTTWIFYLWYKRKIKF